MNLIDDIRVYNYIREKITVLFPKGIWRRVHYNPMTLKAQWVSFYDCISEMHQGWLEWDEEIQAYRWHFEDIEEEFRFYREYTPRRKTYRDCSPLAIAIRKFQNSHANKTEEYWK